MKTTDIRPQELMDKQRQAMLADVEFLASRKTQFIEVGCPACDSRDADFRYEKYGLKHRACRHCETQYISPRPSPEILDQFYRSSQNYDYWAKHIFPASAEVRREKIFKPRAQRVADLCQKFGMSHGTLLEVGAGYGQFCEEIKKLQVFDRIIGVEPTPRLASICREKGIEILESVVEKVHLDTRVDVIANFEVLEHLFNPFQFLVSCHKLLKKGGHLILTCPNVAGFEIQVLGAASDSVDHEHLNYFSPSSLSRLAERAGFEIIAVETPGVLDTDLVYQKLLNEQITIDPMIRKLLLAGEDTRTALQLVLRQAGLSSNMMLIARAVH